MSIMMSRSKIRAQKQPYLATFYASYNLVNEEFICCSNSSLIFFHFYVSKILFGLELTFQSEINSRILKYLSGQYPRLSSETLVLRVYLSDLNTFICVCFTKVDLLSYTNQQNIWSDLCHLLIFENINGRDKKGGGDIIRQPMSFISRWWVDLSESNLDISKSIISTVWVQLWDISLCLLQYRSPIRGQFDETKTHVETLMSTK